MERLQLQVCTRLLVHARGRIIANQLVDFTDQTDGRWKKMKEIKTELVQRGSSKCKLVE